MAATPLDTCDADFQIRSGFRPSLLDASTQMLNLLGCHQSDLETPALCLDLKAQEEIASRFAPQSSLSEPRPCCWPSGHELCLPRLAEVHLQRGARGLGFSHLPSLVTASNQQSDPLHFDGKIACGWQVQLLHRLAPSAQVVFECDHYIQAELLSNLALKLNRTFDILLEVNVGLNRTGVRPGADGRDLAKGLQSLKGVRVVGFCGDLGQELDDSSLSPRWLESRIRLMTDLRSSFPADSRDQLQVHLKGGPALRDLVTQPDVTDLHMPSCSGIAPQWNPLTLISSVISRCKLERAVIDAGWRQTGDKSSWSIVETASGRPLPDLQGIEVAETISTLTLGPESLDIVMGDTVQVVPPDPQLALQLATCLYGVRDGIVEEVWRRDFSGCWKPESRSPHVA